MNYIHNHDDYATEPVRGLPAALPRGEFVLWQGAPSWRGFARQVFHTRTLALLVALGASARALMAANAGASLGTALGEASIILAFGLAGIAILMLLAWLVEKTTVYTITNKRIMMRIGVALQKTFNVPFAVIESASLKANGHDIGNLSVTLKPGVSLAYLILWPHARPWRMAQTQPTLRAIPNASSVARLLTDAFTSYVQTEEALQRSGAKNLAIDGQSAITNETEARTEANKPHDPHHVPKSLVMMAAGAALLTVLVVAFAQWTDTGALRGNAGTPEFAEEIAFIALDGGRFAVLTGDGQTLTTIEEGTDGLLRGALRGLTMSRDQAGADADASFVLQTFADDGVYLFDPLTSRSVRLESFGPIETGATADLLRFGHSGGSAAGQ